MQQQQQQPIIDLTNPAKRQKAPLPSNYICNIMFHFELEHVQYTIRKAEEQKQQRTTIICHIMF